MDGVVIVLLAITLLGKLYWVAAYIVVARGFLFAVQVYVNLCVLTKKEREEKEQEELRRQEDEALQRELEIKREKRDSVPLDSPILWKQDINDTGVMDQAGAPFTLVAHDPRLWACGFEELGTGETMTVDMFSWCANTGQIPEYIPTRLGYWRDGHRYPYMNPVHGDPYFHEHLSQLQKDWAQKKRK